jgi:hypothetical protein
MSGVELSRPMPRGPRLHSIISMPPEVWAFELTYLRAPPTDEGYQRAIRAIRQTLAQGISGDVQDILYNQLALLESWREPLSRRGRRKGSKKPQQHRRSQDQEQLEKLTETIRGWYAVHRSYPTKPEAMQQMGWWADPKRVWDLLQAFNRPPWREFVRQVVSD